MFGHARGGFTGAVADTPGYLVEADGGTVFFDEIGGLPLALQPKLLRAIETRRFRPVGARSDRCADFRVVAATNEDFDRMAVQGQFRADLLYRLRGVVVHVPALVEHPEDIPQLVDHFMRELAPYAESLELTDEALALLCAYDWPGNVRQLRQVIGCAAASGPLRISREEVVAALADQRPSGAKSGPVDLGRHRLKLVLDEVGWDTGAAARVLGVHRATVYRRMQRLGLVPPRRLWTLDSHLRANSRGLGANRANSSLAAVSQSAVAP